ncbi:glycosyltransferase 87 family protein [Kribbella sp. NPDC051718]|uniref:glycosyltransferase 87 family protein n=1 Tax=Kribbella sp. NPDC051718 TaxID=3155168 RepID=UPI003424C1BC
MRSKWLWGVAFGVCVVASVVLPTHWRHSLVDLKVYRLGGMTLLDDAAGLYDVRLAGLPFTYPPFAAVVMVPFALLPWAVAVVVWTLGTFVSLVAVWRLSVGRVMASPVLLGVVAGSLLLEPVRETLGFGQVNLMLCALVLYDLLGQRRGRGIWVGLAAGVKLTPLVFLGLLVVTRQWKALAYASAGFVGSVVVGFVVTPHGAEEYWTSLLADTTRIGGLAFSSNQSWNGFLIRLSGDLDGGGAIWLGLVALTVGGGLWLAQQLWRRGERVAAVAVTGVVGLLCSPVSWSHHWVWAIPLGVAVIGRLTKYRVVFGVLWFGVFAVAPIWWPPNHENRELDWSVAEQFSGNAYLIAAMVAVGILAIGLRQNCKSGIDRRDPGDCQADSGDIGDPGGVGEAPVVGGGGGLRRRRGGAAVRLGPHRG